MKTDSETRRDVEAELHWSPDIDQTDIAVKVSGGVVTLAGYVPTYADKYRAEAAVKRVAGVSAVANDLAVRVPLGGMPTDPEIARGAVAALKRTLPQFAEDITALVHEGHVALEGIVEWHFQRERAERVVREVPGVISVRNSIRLKPRLTPTEIKHRIEQAFQRSAAVDAQHVIVETRGAEVTLRGEVRSWAERDEAQRTAWSAPGVVDVRNELAVRT
jgi:osmotically-inducible protein OsmY